MHYSRKNWSSNFYFIQPKNGAYKNISVSLPSLPLLSVSRSTSSVPIMYVHSVRWSEMLLLLLAVFFLLAGGAGLGMTAAAAAKAVHLLCFATSWGVTVWAMRFLFWRDLYILFNFQIRSIKCIISFENFIYYYKKYPCVATDEA